MKNRTGVAIGVLAALCLSLVAVATWSTPHAPKARPVSKRPERNRYSAAGSKGERQKEGDLLERELYWANRLGYPTGRFNPAWVREAVAQAQRIESSVPSGRAAARSANSPLSLNSTSFTELGPKPEIMTGCAFCFDYGITAGRVNTIVVDPTTTTNGSIVAYAGTVGGGVWKTTNCCGPSTTWSAKTEDAAISTLSISSVAIDPKNHNTIYAGTGDLNFGSFSMGSQGILKSVNGGATWSVLGSDVFGAAYPEPAGNFPQYQAVGKVRVDPNDGNKVVAGTKTGLYFSYDGGNAWTGPCLTNGFTSQRQDITGLELTNIKGSTRILAAVGTRGFATPVQFDLGNNGANGIYRGTMPASGCPADFTPIAGNANGFVFGKQVGGSPYATAEPLNAATGTPYGGQGAGNQLGRVELTVAPNNQDVFYAQVQSITPNPNFGCFFSPGCQLGVWYSTNAGNSWQFLTGSAGGSLLDCAGFDGDFGQNWYDQALAVDPNNADRLFISTYDVWFANRTGTSLRNTTCGYSYFYFQDQGPVHVDQHAIAFVPGNSNIVLIGNDGGIHAATDANLASKNVSPTWFNMDTGLSTHEFYSGDISGNFASAPAPAANGGTQDNGSVAVTFAGSPTGPVPWQLGLGGDGFYARIDPVGTGASPRFFQTNNGGGTGRCVTGCTDPFANWEDITGDYVNDLRSFIMPVDIFHGGIPGGDDCDAPGATTGCGHLTVGTTRVWETTTGADSSVSWYVTNNPTSQDMTKGTLGGRSFINQVKYSPKYQSVAMAGTNDGNAWIGFNLGTGAEGQSNWVDVTGSNAVLPNRPILGVALDPSVAAASVPVGYAAMGGFDQNTPSTPGHVFRVACTAGCGSATWLNKSGNLPNIPVDSIIVNPNFPQQVFAGTDIGLYYTNDVTVASPVWYRFNNGLPNVMIWDMQIDRGSTTLSLWTRGRGAFVWPLPGSPFLTPTPTITATPTPTPTPKPAVTPALTSFRDVRRPADINVGPDLGGTSHTAMNFTGTAGSGGDTWITVYDTTPADDTVKDLYGNVHLSADVLIHAYNNKKGAGVLALFNEGAGQKGLALLVTNSGGTDTLVLGTVSKATGTFTPLKEVSLGPGIAENVWYRVTMDVAVSGGNVAVTGKVFGHAAPSDPGSGVGAQIGPTLTFSDVLPAGVETTGEVGFAAWAVSAAVDSSVTNLKIEPF